MLQFFRSNTILTGAALIALGGILSRLLGLLRDFLLASTFGAGRELDIYYAAFRIPDFIYAILILGAISATFIPVFSSLSTKEEQNRFASIALNIVTLGIAFISLILVFLAPFVVDLIAPGFESQDRALTILLTRIMLIQPVLLAMSNVVTSVLQSFRRFLTTALAPSFYNAGIIFGIIVFVPRFGLPGLAYGVILGAFLHLIIQLPALLQTHMSWDPLLSFTKEVKEMVALMGPRMLGVASEQVNLVVITAIASTLALGSITIFNLAQNIQAAPIGIIGIAVATAAFPSLSRAFHKENGEFTTTFLSSFRLILFFSIPLSLLFILLRAQIVRVVLGAGLFGWEDTRLTAAALGVFGMSLFAQSLIPLLTRAFYSMKDTKTPVIISISAVLLNIGLAFTFVYLLSQATPFYDYIVATLKLSVIPDIRVIGLPLAFSITMLLQFLFLFVFLSMRFKPEYMYHLNRAWLKILASSFAMAGITYLSLRPLALILDMATRLGVFLQGFGAGLIGIAIYFVITYLLNENPIINSNRKMQSVKVL